MKKTNVAKFLTSLLIAFTTLLTAPSSVFAQTADGKAVAAKPVPVKRHGIGTSSPPSSKAKRKKSAKQQKSDAESSQKARKEIQYALSQADAALAQKYLKGALAATTPDFVAVMMDKRKISLPAYRDAYARLFRQASIIQSVTRVQGIAVNGSKASVIVSNRSRIRGAEKNGHPRDITAEGEESQLWVKKGGKWLLKRTQALTHSATANVAASR